MRGEKILNSINIDNFWKKQWHKTMFYFTVLAKERKKVVFYSSVMENLPQRIVEANIRYVISSIYPAYPKNVLNWSGGKIKKTVQHWARHLRRFVQNQYFKHHISANYDELAYHKYNPSFTRKLNLSILPKTTVRKGARLRKVNYL